MKTEVEVNMPVINDVKAHTVLPVKSGYGYANVGTTDTAVYEIASPEVTFYVKKLVITNTSGADVDVTIKDNTNTVMKIHVANGETKDISFDGDGLPIQTSLVAVSSANTVDLTAYGKVTYLLE